MLKSLVLSLVASTQIIASGYSSNQAMIVAPADPQDGLKTFCTPYDQGAVESNYLSMINSAKKSIRVCAYGFTDPDVTSALVAAHARGVDVAVIMDSTQAAGPHQVPMVDQLRKAGIEVTIGKSAVHSQLIHAKFTVVDNLYTESGSWNYSGGTASAQDNTVDFVVSESRAQILSDFWTKIRAHILTTKGASK